MKPKLINNIKCTGCAACADVCRHHAIHMDYDKNGFLRPFITEKNCIGCKACEKTCPVLNFKKLPFHDIREIKHYAAWSNNDEVCINASSGGIFSQLAINLLEENKDSIVFGAELSQNNTCVHIGVTKRTDLNKIIGTKYIQSNAEGTYKKVKKALSENQRVLYCGTPCQIAGLYATLGFKDNDNLFTAELICHGVGSKITADVATSYVGAECIHSFRDKADGWCGPNLERVSQKNTYKMSDGKMFRPVKNIYWEAFSTSHRLSCTSCPFATLPRLADVSLGDLWGLYKQYPQRCTLGASLVLANSEKGNCMIRSRNIVAIEHPKSQINCYTLFYPGTSRFMQLSNLLFLINKLPTNIAFYIMSMNWRKIPFLIPLKIVFKYISKYHLKATLKSIDNTKRRLKWQ